MPDSMPASRPDTASQLEINDDGASIDEITNQPSEIASYAYQPQDLTPIQDESFSHFETLSREDFNPHFNLGEIIVFTIFHILSTAILYFAFNEWNELPTFVFCFLIH